MSLGRRLKKAREYAGRAMGSKKKLSQKQLAERSGVSQQMISKLELGRSKETSGIVALAIYCGVRPEWLSDGTGPMVGKSEPDGEVLLSIVRMIQDVQTEMKRIDERLERMERYLGRW
jgi:transcriptional regulator with XRE-family HTH domain